MDRDVRAVGDDARERGEGRDVSTVAPEPGFGNRRRVDGHRGRKRGVGAARAPPRGTKLAPRSRRRRRERTRGVRRDALPAASQRRAKSVRGRLREGRVFERLRANRRRRHVSRGSRGGRVQLPRARRVVGRHPWPGRRPDSVRGGWREIGAVDPDVGGRVTNAGGARRGRRHRRRARVRGGRLRQPRRVGRRGSAGGVFPRWSRGRRRTHGTA